MFRNHEVDKCVLQKKTYDKPCDESYVKGHLYVHIYKLSPTCISTEHRLELDHSGDKKMTSWTSVTVTIYSLENHLFKVDRILVGGLPPVNQAGPTQYTQALCVSNFIKYLVVNLFPSIEE